MKIFSVSALTTSIALFALSLLGAAGALLAASPDTLAPPAPSGLITFSTLAQCAPGWTQPASAAGRMLVGTTTAGAVGLTVGTSLANLEERSHRHGLATTVEIPDKSISGASGCCNRQGARQGLSPINGTSDPSTTDLPFAQLLVCKKD